MNRSLILSVTLSIISGTGLAQSKLPPATPPAKPITVTAKPTTVQPVVSKDLVSVQRVAVNSEQQVAVIGEFTKSTIVKGSETQKKAYLALYQQNGTLIREDTAKLPRNAIFTDIAFDEQSNIYVLGDVVGYPQGGSGRDVFLAKLKPNGERAWLKLLSAPQQEPRLDQAAAVSVSGDGNVYALFNTKTSGTEASSPMGTQVVVVKFNSSGVQEWRASLGTAEQDRAVDLDVSYDGRVSVLSRRDYARPTIVSDLTQLDAGTGRALLRSALPSGLRGLAMMSDDRTGTTIIAGQMLGKDGKQGFVGAFNKNGQELWRQATPVDAKGVATYTSVALGKDGSVYVAGRALSPLACGASCPAGTIAGVVRKFTAQGQPSGELTVDAAGDEDLTGLAVSPVGQVWLGGSSYQNQTWGAWMSRTDRNLAGAQPVTLKVTQEPAEVGTPAAPAAAALSPERLKELNSAIDYSVQKSQKALEFSSEKLTYKLDESFALSLKVNPAWGSQKDAFAYIFEIDPQGSVNLLFPNSSDMKNQIGINALYRVPRQGTGIEFYAKPPMGTSRMVALIVQKPYDLLDKSMFKLLPEGFFEIQNDGVKQLISDLSTSIKCFPMRDSCDYYIAANSISIKVIP